MTQNLFPANPSAPSLGERSVQGEGSLVNHLGSVSEEDGGGVEEVCPPNGSCPDASVDEALPGTPIRTVKRNLDQVLCVCVCVCVVCVCVCVCKEGERRRERAVHRKKSNKVCWKVYIFFVGSIHGVFGVGM
jgi:hypothetical protein